jgi:hypothetical protein
MSWGWYHRRDRLDEIIVLNYTLIKQKSKEKFLGYQNSDLNFDK